MSEQSVTQQNNLDPVKYVELDIPDSEIVIDKSKLRTERGHFLTQSLFDWANTPLTDNFIFTLGDNHREYKGRILYSMRRLYLSCNDPTEYEFANKFLLGWEHWKKIQSNLKIYPYVQKWREELAVKIRSDAFLAAQKASQAGSFNAAKWLATEEYKRGKGRPSKLQIEAEIKKEIASTKEEKEDLNRLLRVVNDG